MRFLKGLLAMSGAGVALVIATIILFVLKMRSTGAQGADVKALWVWMLSSPIYWLTVLALIGATVWLFRRWVLA
jgi:hypothetical protein